MIFAQMLEIVALSDLASVLCARKFSFDPQGGIYPLPRDLSVACLLLLKISLVLAYKISDNFPKTTRFN